MYSTAVAPAGEMAPPCHKKNCLIVYRMSNAHHPCPTLAVEPSHPHGGRYVVFAPLWAAASRMLSKKFLTK